MSPIISLIVINVTLVAIVLHTVTGHKQPQRRLSALVWGAWYITAINLVLALHAKLTNDGESLVAGVVASALWLSVGLVLHAVYARRAGGHITFEQMRDE